MQKNIYYTSKKSLRTRVRPKLFACKKFCVWSEQAKIRPISEVFYKKNEPESPQFLHPYVDRKMTCWGVKCIGESDSAGNGNVPCHFRSLAARQYF